MHPKSLTLLDIDMNYYLPLTIYFLTGLIFITLIDTIGAFASRKLNFKYVYLSVVSFIVYVGIGYLISKQYGVTLALITNAILGFYDSTVGMRLSIIVKANSNDVTGIEGNPKMIIGIITTAISFGLVGYFLSGV